MNEHVYARTVNFVCNEEGLQKRIGRVIIFFSEILNIFMMFSSVLESVHLVHAICKMVSLKYFIGNKF